ncbi:MAG: DUF3426 domain-containing protein [Pseudomonadota bacterium]|jgi:predicted Zn finger-like uncharacterized protein
MSMVTTCPQCHTRFKVTQEQLQAHGGDVRCGRCALVFNAFATLAPAEAPPAAGRLAAIEEEISPIEPAAAAPEISPEPVEQEAAPAEESPHEEPLPPSPEAQPAEEALAEEPTAEEPPTEIAPEPQPAEFTEPEEALPLAAEFPEESVPAGRQPGGKKRRRVWPWLAGAMLLLVLLAGQAAYFFRDQLAAYNPQWKPTLQQSCAAFGCRIGLLREADLLGIESSDLRADPARPSLVVLTATLRNRAPFPQAYPLLELTLTDAKDKVVARRILTPAEYAPQADAAAGFPPRSELAVKLHVDLGELKAAGYRLYLFYSAP